MAVLALNALIGSDVLNKILFEHYAIRGKIKKLSGERDQNFYLVTEDNQEYVVKVSVLSALKEIEFQNEVLNWLFKSSLPTPRVINTKTGCSCVKIEMGNGEIGVLRILSWLKGTALGDIAYTTEVVKNVAQTQSKINSSLSNFSTNYVKHDLVWDMEQLDSLDYLVKPVNLGERFALIRQTFDKFKTEIQPKLNSCRRQIIHNDFNPHNVLVDVNTQQVTGVLDFGDVIEGPLIVDVAVALAYLIDIDVKDPLHNISHYICEYNKTYRLFDNELEILLDLIKTRLAMILVISSWRAAEYPDRKEYVMRNNQLSWLRLKAVNSIGIDNFNVNIKKLCAVS